MNTKKFSEAMNEVDDRYVSEVINYKKKGNKQVFIKWASVAACFAFIIVGVYSFLPKDDTIFKGENLTVKSVDFSQTEITISSADLAMLTEDDIFNKYNTVIFKGVVSNIENIEIDFGGEVLYNSIATISVQDVYRGDLQTNEEVKILLPTPIDVDGLWVSDTEVISQVRVGMTGIFMPLVLDDETAMRQQNGIQFDKREIVDYGLLDGERYAFLETENGLVFAEWAYESISNAGTLDDVEQYIFDMIE